MILSDHDLHPYWFISVSTKIIDSVIVCDAFVLPLFHKCWYSVFDCNTTDPPLQNDNGPLAETLGVGGKGLTVMLIGSEVAEHPLLSITVTKYCPLTNGVIDPPKVLSDHWYCCDVLEIKVDGELIQYSAGPIKLIEATALLYRSVVIDALLVHPLFPVTITEYVPLESVDKLGEVDPLFHWKFPDALLVNTTLLPGQKFVGPDEVITGATGWLIEVIEILSVSVQPFASVTVTVYVQALEITCWLVLDPADHR